MITAELFCGTKSFSKVLKDRGASIWTIDNEQEFSPSVCIDVRLLKDDYFKSRPPIDLFWASPPCQGFSVASLSKNWRDGQPISDSAKLGVELVRKTLKLIMKGDVKYWFIENPRGMLRTVFEHLAVLEGFDPQTFKRVTVTYCQYGDSRMKPTDIWTNAQFWTPRPPCKNGDPCHESAPRGSRTGTQGIKGAKDRGVIPPALFEEIASQFGKYERRHNIR